MTTDNKYKVPALDKAIAIIETLAVHDTPLGVSELCKMVEIPKTSVFFILNTLEQHQYIFKSAEGKYSLGSKFITIGLSALNRLDIRDRALSVMEELMNETGFTVHLAVPDQYEAMYLAKVENQAFVKFSTYIGQRQPLHASGVGKAIAAFLPAEQVEEAIRVKGLPEKTERTITNRQDFLTQLEIIRQQGYSVEDEEGESGIRCIGAPVFDHLGVLKAAVSITALRTELPIHDIPRVGEQVKNAANRISERLGYPLPTK
ncbi:IclR family transcriptional regulator [Paenibacillus sp. J31TS4]|uniref:IclR family transcriptional regulator n=1 Tax=Paenibacillus sp. J31TS4 TaxID=2807195 RepID=UPI001B1BE1BD|nr:IclR family transcriptional regulator [Paenibacillus sp. J31TS4]GIP39928.1 IclR family transcriptional regulator [Paenibacillus sp. J31TS4]